jgi:hypothetical protein
VTISGVTDGVWDAGSQASGSVVGGAARAHNASALAESAGAPESGAVGEGVEPPLQATSTRVSAAIAAKRGRRITGTA